MSRKFAIIDIENKVHVIMYSDQFARLEFRTICDKMISAGTAYHWSKDELKERISNSALVLESFCRDCAVSFVEKAEFNAKDFSYRLK